MIYLSETFIIIYDYILLISVLCVANVCKLKPHQQFMHNLWLFKLI